MIRLTLFSQNSNAAETDVINTLLLRAASRSEKAISYARIVIVLLMLIRFVIINPPLSAYIVAVPAAILSVIFSLAFLFYHNSKSAHPIWLWLSVLVDAVASCVILLNNVLTPWEGYTGTLRLPDMAILLIVVFAAGFRLSVRIALFGGLVNILSLMLVVLLDMSVNRVLIDYGWAEFTMWLIMLFGAMFAAIISARRTRTLSLEGAQESIRLDRARSGMKTLLQSHHDAHSLLSSVHLNAEQLINITRGVDPVVAKLADNLTDDLQAIKSCVQQLKQSADGQFKASLEPTPVDLNATIPRVVERMNHIMTDITINYQPVAEALWIELAGGINSLNRILVNVLQNAYEGDGRKGATRVDIVVEKAREKAKLSVLDDGPGFTTDPTKPGSGAKGFEKVTGLNVGLASVRNIVEASGGSVEFCRSYLGGAQIDIVFPIDSCI